MQVFKRKVHLYGAMQICFRLFLATKTPYLRSVLNGNFNSQKDNEDEDFLLKNILHFVLKCILNITNM